MQGPGDRVEVDQLLGEERDGAGEDADGLHPAFMEVVHMPLDRALPHALVRRRQLGGRQMVERLPHPGGQPRAEEPGGFGGGRLGRGTGSSDTGSSG